MKDVRQMAQDNFASGYNCAEAVLLAVAQAMGAPLDHIQRLATGFGGGIGRCGEVCGALSGAVMALGLRYGRIQPDDVEARDRTYGLAETLIQEFEEAFGNIHCLSLTGCDLRTPEGLAKARAMDLHGSFCPKFVAFAAERALRMIEEEAKADS